MLTELEFTPPLEFEFGIYVLHKMSEKLLPRQIYPGGQTVHGPPLGPVYPARHLHEVLEFDVVPPYVYEFGTTTLHKNLEAPPGQ